MKPHNTHIPDIVGAGYRAFWGCERRYCVVKGGRGSKKSTTAALRLVARMMYYYKRYGLCPHALVVRRYANTNLDSTFAQIRWAIDRLGVSRQWKVLKSPLKLIFKPSGQEIIFRGLDEPQKLTSIVPAFGHLCWVWIEEAYQVTNQDDFNKLDLSIRGALPAPLFKQITLTLNPWHEGHWIKERFFDVEDPNVFAITRNYDCNEFLGEDDLALFEDMKLRFPKRYEVEGKGNWGISQGLIYENWEKANFDENKILSRRIDGRYVNFRMNGMDFGYTDPTAMLFGVVAERTKEIFIYDEFYKAGTLNSDVIRFLRDKGYIGFHIAADGEDPHTIAELNALGARGIVAASKGWGSVNAGILKIQEYKIYVKPHCENFIADLLGYRWKEDKNTGKATSTPDHDHSHGPDALRYGMEKIGTPSFSWGRNNRGGHIQ